MNENPPLKVTDLRKDFPGRKGIGTVHAVSDISFQVNSGEIVGFIGHNGAGKTTTIKCALGLLKASAGRISLWGLPPASAAARKRIGYVPENPD